MLGRRQFGSVIADDVSAPKQRFLRPVRDGQLWLYGMHIGEYRQANSFGHKPLQPRKLLLNRSELEKLRGKLTAKGLTMVPDQLHFRRGWAKIVLCLAKGKDKGDRRRDLMTREAKRDVEREVARRAKHG